MTREDYWVIPENVKERSFINERILTLAMSIDIDLDKELNELARAVYEEYKSAGVFNSVNIDKLTEVSKRVEFEKIENRLDEDIKEKVEKFENCIIDIEESRDKEFLNRINSIGQGVIDKDDKIDDI